jgi:Zn-dependent M28 family amino/carboxypeptidase
MKIRFVIYAFLVLLGAAACKPEPEAAATPPPASISLEDAQSAVDLDRMLTNITELSSDRFGGRAPMSEGERLTLKLIEDQFREMGLAPLFGDSYLQAVDMVSIEAEPSSVQMTFRMDGTDRLVRYQDEMVAGTSRIQPISLVESSDIVFVGYGIVAPEYGWDDYADVDVTGKTVLILINDPGFASQNPAMFKGNAMTYYGRWTYKYEEAARQGAAAAIIIHDTAPAAYGWEVVRNSGTGPQFHLYGDDDNKDRVAIEAWIQRAVAEELIAASGFDLAALEQSALSPEFAAVELESTMDARIENHIVRNKSFNVGALLPGSSHPDEVFIYTAHWDHLGTDLQATEDEDGIYNGAVDNATGISALLELGHSFAALPRAPARSVAFLAVTAEESGLLGSAFYTESPALPMNKTVGGINMDSLGVYGPTSDMVVVGYGSSELEDILIRKAGEQDRYIKPEPHPERGGYYRSDHFNFARKGVPMLYAKSGAEHREKGPDYIPEKSLDFLKNRYHTVRDEVGDDWDLRGAAEDVGVYFRIGLEVADSEDWPQWYEGNEFRAIRESSLY